MVGERGPAGGGRTARHRAQTASRYRRRLGHAGSRRRAARRGAIMSEKDVRYLALGGAAVVITLLVGIATGWKLITLLVGAVLVGSVLAVRIFPHLVTGSESPVARPQGAQAVPGQLRKVGPVSLETATPEFRMMFSATVVWHPNRRAEPARSAPVRLSQPHVP